MILKGFIKKAIIADYVAQYVNLVYAQPTGYSGFENWMAMYAYTLQIYCDFSGYSDMAIGLALVLGFRLPDNFRSPYQALNITDFWRRWHISLSTWLRDYIYIPLGGNRGGGWGAQLLLILFMLLGLIITGWWWLLAIYIPCLIITYSIRDTKKRMRWFMYINLLLTMLIGGWWHGANWKFVFWGCMHGMGLIIHKLYSSSNLLTSLRSYRLYKGLSWLLTFHFVAFLWIYFRATNYEMASDSIIAMWTDLDSRYILAFWEARPVVILFLLVGFGLHFVSLKEKQRMQDYFAELPWPGKAILFIIAIQIALQFQDASVQPFIYFQF